MRARPRLVTAVLAVVVLSGCSDTPADRAGAVDQPPAAGAVEGQREVADRVYSAAQVESALLTVADLPTGWSVKPDDSATENPSDDYALCPEFAAVMKKTADLEDFAAGFTSPTGSDLGEVIMSLPQAEARTLLADLSKAVSACPKLKGRTDGDVPYDLDLAALSFPKLADETFAMRMTAELYGDTVTSDVVMVRRGGVLVMISQTAAGPTDTVVTEDVARRAVAKAEKVLA